MALLAGTISLACLVSDISSCSVENARGLIRLLATVVNAEPTIGISSQHRQMKALRSMSSTSVVFYVCWDVCVEITHSSTESDRGVDCERIEALELRAKVAQLERLLAETRSCLAAEQARTNVMSQEMQAMKQEGLRMQSDSHALQLAMTTMLNVGAEAMSNLGKQALLHEVLQGLLRR